mmetsp:Transcript_10538/g.27952  ORF Transcript_10538/g.27952 Transcript_10538/m.27952 type:complete len:107 (-) Transcript_10538:182-502(-)
MPPRWLAPGIIFRPDKKSAAGAYPRRGRREEGSAAYVVRIRKVQLGVVMVAEGNDAGMRRRVRRDQNDREEKAETMRRESGTNLDFLSGARGRGAPPLPRAILAES